jgi:hypothetical protein
MKRRNELRKLKNEVTDLHRELTWLTLQLNEDRRGLTAYAPIEAMKLAEDADGRSLKNETRLAELGARLAELGAQFLTHADLVLVNDASAPQGTRLLRKLDLYRGRTHEGQRIHQVRQSWDSVTEYHIEGKGYTDEEFNRG